MTTLSIPLSDDRFARLREFAATAGVSPEEFLRHRVEQMLDQPNVDFQRGADRVLEKNAELYRRLENCTKP